MTVDDDHAHTTVAEVAIDILHRRIGIVLLRRCVVIVRPFLLHTVVESSIASVLVMVDDIRK